MTTYSEQDADRQRSHSLASTTALSRQLSLSALPDELARRLDLADQVMHSQFWLDAVLKPQMLRKRHATIAQPSYACKAALAGQMAVWRVYIPPFPRRICDV